MLLPVPVRVWYYIAIPKANFIMTLKDFQDFVTPATSSIHFWYATEKEHINLK